MKHNWFASSIGAVALALGTAWTHAEVVYAVSFTPPSDAAAPRGTTGGASRDSFFTPPSDAAAPRRTTGGASRGTFFVPPSDAAAPRGTTGGASRDSFFTPPPYEGSPQGATGGASRRLFNSSYESTSQGLVETTNSSARSNVYGETAVLPVAGETSMLAVMPDSFFGTTVEARPTVMVYVPASNASEAVFSIKDEVKDSVYEMTVSIPSFGGIVAVELPPEAPELTIDQNYQWYLALKIDGALKPASPFVDGWVKRVNPTGRMFADNSSAIAQIEALGSSGIWYDTAAKLASLRVAENDETISKHWYELLESVGLAEIAAAPIVMQP